MRGIGFAAAMMLGLGMPLPARAYSSSASFSQDAAAGGGGGRLFTGAERDGFSCAVCHAGVPARLRVVGLEDRSLAPGVDQLVEVWTTSGNDLAAHIELSGRNGGRGGEVLPLDAGSLTSADRCADGRERGEAMAADGERSVLRFAACGATRTRFVLRGGDVDGAMLNIAVVVPNTDGSSRDDVTGHLAYALVAPGAPELERSVVDGGCAMARDRSGDTPRSIAVLGFALWLASRRRRALRATAGSSRRA